MNMNNTYDNTLHKLATMEERISTKASITLFDRALILSDLFEVSKDKAFWDLVEARKNAMKINHSLLKNTY